MKLIYDIPKKYNNLLNGLFISGPTPDNYNKPLILEYDYDRGENIEFIFSGYRNFMEVAENDCILDMIKCPNNRLFVSNKVQFLNIKNSWNLNVYYMYVMDCGYIEICAKSCAVRIGSEIVELDSVV